MTELQVTQCTEIYAPSTLDEGEIWNVFDYVPYKNHKPTISIKFLQFEVFEN